MKYIYILLFLSSFFFINSKENFLEFKSNIFSAELNGTPIDFFLSSSLKDSISLDYDTVEKLNLKDNIINKINIASIKKENIRFELSEKNIIGFGLLRDYNLKLDYKKNKIIFDCENFEGEIDFKIEDDFISLNANFLNWEIDEFLSFDTNEEYNYLNNNFIKKMNFDKKLFPVAELFDNNSFLTKKYPYYEDVDLKINSNFYNKIFIFAPKKNTLGVDFFKSSIITINFKEKKIKIENGDEREEYCDELLSKNDLKNLLSFLESNKDWELSNFFKAIYYDRVGKDEVAKKILFDEIYNDLNSKKHIDEKIIKRLLSLINELPYPSDIEKLID
ncbi:MAG TPA: hypothetical protein PLO89_08265, partial [Spirochaetota bacterium]|nr:hypothetical protein [Spirochaetota bacterium]